MIWALGFVTLFLLLKEPALVVYRLFLRAPIKPTQFGKWAVVTGATDGIGKAMALELARKRMNVLLISRTESKLVEVAKEVESIGVEAKYLAIDFSSFDESDRSKVAKALEGMDVGVLVNNVGVSYPYPKYFHELNDQQVTALVELNVNSTLGMTRLALPGMLERKRGCVVNISTGASLKPMPLLAGYNGAKSFVNGLTTSLASEYAGKGVHFQVQVPLFVTTKLAKIRNPSITTPTPEGYARSAVAAIGYESMVSPYWAHALLIWVMNLLPTFVTDKVLMGMHLPLRSRGMKKDQQK